MSRLMAVLFLIVGNAAGNLLEYNYYFELNDAVSKFHHLGTDFAELLSHALGGSLAASAGYPKITAEFATATAASETAEDVVAADRSVMVLEAIFAALMGDCEPFIGYGTGFINAPTSGVYSKDFWCLHV